MSLDTDFSHETLCALQKMNLSNSASDGDVVTRSEPLRNGGRANDDEQRPAPFFDCVPDAVLCWAMLPFWKISTVSAMASTCRRFHALSNQNAVWRLLCRRDLPVLAPASFVKAIHYQLAAIQRCLQSDLPDRVVLASCSERLAAVSALIEESKPARANDEALQANAPGFSLAAMFAEFPKPESQRAFVFLCEIALQRSGAVAVAVLWLQRTLLKSWGFAVFARFDDMQFNSQAKLGSLAATPE